MADRKATKHADSLEQVSNPPQLPNSGWKCEWNDRKATKHADSLEQVSNPPQLPNSGWKCEWNDCDQANNLWLNLSSGKIFCGRSNFDGSGGKNHAIEHYKTTGAKHPLVVKLGTITSDGNADIHSYDEDDLVSDPNLGSHLAHFGLDIAKLEKTEKTIKEMEDEMAESAQN